MGRLPDYGIRPGYQARSKPKPWNDIQYKDEFQRPVYELARRVMEENGFRTVLDIGTGSGWKLVHILGDFETIGTEVQPILDFLRKQYPGRRWLLSKLEKPCPVREVDLVLAADVVEHLENPDLLMDYIAGIRWKRLILSTPDRDKARGREDRGPPANPCHVREWNAEEFRRYVEQWFPVLEQKHFGSTQVLVCMPPRAAMREKWKEGPGVTILIPVRDTPARMLWACWESILTQTWPHWEVIFVDDGSQVPETVTLLEQLGRDNRVRVIRQGPRGIGAALQAGLEASGNELIARQDADDLMMPERLARQVQYMLEHPEVDVLGGQVEAFEDETGQVRWRTEHPPVVRLEAIRPQILAGQPPWFVNHPAVMFRRSRAAAVGGFNPALAAGAELDLWLRLLQAGGQVHNLPEVVVRYRLHPGQTVRKPTFREHIGKLMDRWRGAFLGKLPDRLFLIGYPGDVGGAGTECWHTLMLWSRFGFYVTCIPTWSCSLDWEKRVKELGHRTIKVNNPPKGLLDIAELKDSIVVSFCNSQFLNNLEYFRKMNCRIVWAGCMCWLFNAEKEHYRKFGPFDSYIFQSQHQLNTLFPQLSEYGVSVSQCHLIRAPFISDTWEFRPLPHIKGEPFIIGRASRAAPDKFHAKTWEIYKRIDYPIKIKILGWGDSVEKKLGKPPEWAETMPPGAIPIKEFFRSIHCMMQISDSAQENWPRTGLEAMASGVAIVAHNDWGWKEMVIHGETGLLANNEDEFVQYASMLAKDEPLRLKLITNARKHLEENLANPYISWKHWKRVFDSLK